MRLLVILCLSGFFLFGSSGINESEHTIKQYKVASTLPSSLLNTTTLIRPAEIPQSESGFVLLADPIDALVARASLMRKAEHTLDVQYYIYRNDLSGQILANEMLLAADRGVTVRLLLDDLGSYGNDDYLLVLSAHPNINIRLFNAFSRSRTMIGQLFTGFGKKTRRMHNKALIADNQFSILGGRNIGNEYFGANPDILFDDLDVLLSNPVTDDVSDLFDEFWNSPKARNVSEKMPKQYTGKHLNNVRGQLEQYLLQQSDSAYAKAVNSSLWVNANGLSEIPFNWAYTQLKADNAIKLSASRDEYDLMLAPQLEPLIHSLSERFIMVSPYFVPGEDGLKFFQSLRDKGIEVIVITNSLAANDVPIVHSGYAKYRNDLLEMGVIIHEADGRTIEKRKKNKFPDWFASHSSLHAKFFIFDDTTTFIGSFNFDPRSYYENTEVGVSIYSQSLSTDLAEEVLAILPTHTFEVSLDEKGNLQWKIGDETFDVEPGTSWFKRTANRFMGLLPVESEL